MSTGGKPSRVARLRGTLGTAVTTHLSPEHTRAPTRIERLTVRKLEWSRLTRIHSWLEAAGKVATTIYVVFVGSVVLGVNWKHTVEATLNSGKPVAGAVALALIIPTLAFVVARSSIGYMRWRVQRELWRRDVERLGG